MPDVDVVFVDVLADVRHEVGGEFKSPAVKDDEGDIHFGLFILFFVPKEGGKFRQSDLEGLVLGKTVVIGRNQGKRDRLALILQRQPQGLIIAGTQPILLP
jgi:hypothetical protein